MMIERTLNQTQQWLEQAAAQTGARLEDNKLVLTGSPEEGTVSFFPMEEGLTMVLTEVRSNASIPKLRQIMPADHLYLKLYLPECHLDSVVRSGFAHYEITSPGALLYNAHLELKSVFKVRQRFKIVLFAMDARWLKQNFRSDSLFADKRSFEAPLFRFEQVTPAILQAALNLFTLQADTGPLRLRMKAVVYDMLSQALTSFDLRADSNLAAFKYQSDLEAIFRIREQLLDMEDINYPTVAVLAEQAAMSPSKLKMLFRSVFGMSIFEFFQHHRLAYARRLIESRQLSIGEVGLKVGYNNLSKFSQAYKKQFGYLPHLTLLPDRAII